MRQIRWRGRVGVAGVGAGGGGLVAVPPPCGAGLGAPLPLAGFAVPRARRRRQRAFVFLCVGHYQRPFLTATSTPPARQISSKGRADFHGASIPAPPLAGTSVNAFRSNTLIKAEVFMRLSTAVADSDGDCGVRRLGCGIRGQSARILRRRGRRRIADPQRRFLLWVSRLLQRLPIRLAGDRRNTANPHVGLEATYIDFGQPYRHHGYYDYNVSGSDSHPTAPALFAVGYLPLPIPFIDVFAKAGVARLSTNLTDFVQQPCPPNGPCPYFIPTDRQSSDRYANSHMAPACNPKFPFGLILRGEYERISSQFGDPDALMVSALWQF